MIYSHGKEFYVPAKANLAVTHYHSYTHFILIITSLENVSFYTGVLYPIWGVTFCITTTAMANLPQFYCIFVTRPSKNSPRFFVPRHRGCFDKISLDLPPFFYVFDPPFAKWPPAHLFFTSSLIAISQSEPRIFVGVGADWRCVGHVFLWFQPVFVFKASSASVLP